MKIRNFLTKTWYLLTKASTKAESLIPYKDKKILTIYFGVPGSGKSTFAASLVRKCNLHKIPVFSNFPIVGAYEYKCEELGKTQFDNCKIIIDEAGIEFNNRDFKSFSKENLQFFKLHRHYKTSIDVFSQTYNDMDKKIRTLAQKLYVVKRSIIPYFIVCIPIKKKITIDELTHDICDGYYFDHPLLQIFTSKRIFMPKYWKYFNSYDAPKLPKKPHLKYTKT